MALRNLRPEQLRTKFSFVQSRSLGGKLGALSPSKKGGGMWVLGVWKRRDEGQGNGAEPPSNTQDSSLLEPKIKARDTPFSFPY